MRAFIALDLADTVLRDLTRLQAGLSVGRVVPEENLHMTLAFLGDVTEATAFDIADALDGARLSPVRCALSGLEVFGARKSAVLAIGASGDGLVPLQAKVMRLVRQAGHDLARTRFRPHVTIARLAGEMGLREQARLGEFLSLNGAVAYRPEPAVAVTLYCSHLSREGAIHDVLARFPLSDWRTP